MRTKHVITYEWETGDHYGFATVAAESIDDARTLAVARATAGNAAMAARGPRKGGQRAYRVASVREIYRPGMARVGEPTPQSDPRLFTDAEIQAEITYLLKLNQRYGTHPLRVSAYTTLSAFLRERHATATSAS